MTCVWETCLIFNGYDRYFPESIYIYMYGLAQEDNNSSALAMELLQSCAKPSIRPLNGRTTKGVSVPPPRDTCGVGVTKLIFSIPLLSPFLKIDQPFVIFLISSKYFVRCRHLINWTWFKGSQWYFYKIIFHKGETAKGALVIRTTGRAVIQHNLWTNKYKVYWHPLPYSCVTWALNCVSSHRQLDCFPSVIK